MNCSGCRALRLPAWSKRVNSFSLSPVRPSGASSRVAKRSRRPLSVKALVAVDYSQPAIWLGLGLIGGGLSLYQLRRVQPVLSRDLDIVVSSVVIFSGGILIFQGWRLDPLLLFCQLLTTGVALTWALEAIKLRRVVENDQMYDDRIRPWGTQQTGRYPSRQQGIPLPSPREQQMGQWYEEPEASSSEQYQEVPGYEVLSQQNGWDSGYEDPYPYQERPSHRGSYDDEMYYTTTQESELDADEDDEPVSSSSRGIVDSVEGYYNRPDSVTEDVERFYSHPSQSRVDSADPDPWDNEA